MSSALGGGGGGGKSGGAVRCLISRYVEHVELGGSELQHSSYGALYRVVVVRLARVVLSLVDAVYRLQTAATERWIDNKMDG
jgi:hypothetical protein